MLSLRLLEVTTPGGLLVGQAEVLECQGLVCQTPLETDHSFWRAGLSLGRPNVWLSLPLPAKTSGAFLGFFAVRAPL